MSSLVFICFTLGNLLAIVSAGVALVYLRENANQRLLTAAYWLAGGAFASLALMLALRTVQWGLVPLTTATDSISLMTVLALGILVIQMGVDPMQRGLLCFHLPLLGVISGLNLATGFSALAEAPRPLSSMLLIVHVGLVFLAYALLALAGVNSVAYARQAQLLKHRKTTGLFQKLPSLELLDKNLFQLIRIGYPTYVFTLIAGGFWVWYEGDTLSPTWWFSPKVGMALAMLVFYAFAYHARSAGRLRGPKLAHIVCYGTATLITLYLALALAGVLNYNFYGAAG
jgi:ABC-type uncharacterized transport system permease subunit